MWPVKRTTLYVNLQLLGFLFREVDIRAMAKSPCKTCGKVSLSRSARKHHNKNHNKVLPFAFAVFLTDLV